jgi:hypothetical protein
MADLASLEEPVLERREGASDIVTFILLVVVERSGLLEEIVREHDEGRVPTTDEASILCRMGKVIGREGAYR